VNASAPTLASPRPSQAWSEIRDTVKLAAPIGLAQAGHALMGVVDTAVLGRHSAMGQGAVSISNGVYFAIAVVGFGTMLGVDPLISQAFGANDPARARKFLWQGMWLALCASVLLTVPLLFAPMLLRPFGISEELVDLSSLCLWARIPGLLPMLMFSVVRSWLQAAHRVWSITLAVVVANIANLLLNLWLVFGGWGVPELGAVGSSISTSVCSFLQLAIIGLAAAPRREAPKLPVSRRWNGSEVKAAALVGLPIGLQMAAEAGVFTLAGLLAARLGNASVAAHQVVLTYASLTFCFAVGVGSAGSVRVGRAIGAKDTAGARRAGTAAIACTAGFMALAALVFTAFPGALGRSMGNDPEVLKLAIPLFAVAAFFQLSDGIQAVGAGILRGAGDTRLSFVANVLGHYAVGLPIAYLLGIWMEGGVVGLWWGLSAGLTAVAVGLTWRFYALTARTVSAL
jgi:MATE family multidrug resistance protein